MQNQPVNAPYLALQHLQCAHSPHPHKEFCPGNQSILVSNRQEIVGAGGEGGTRKICAPALVLEICMDTLDAHFWILRLDVLHCFCQLELSWRISHVHGGGNISARNLLGEHRKKGSASPRGLQHLAGVFKIVC